LIPTLLAGRGDIVAAGLTITHERQQVVAFTKPYIKNVNEIVVASRKVHGLKSLNDLAGRRIHVVAGTSYVQHLKLLNARFKTKGLKSINIIQVDKTLEEEDLLEMIHAGILELTVVDQHFAELWSRVLTELVVHEDIIIHSGGNIAWAVRKNSPELLASLNEFVIKHGQGTLLGNILIKRYYGSTKWIANPLAPSELKRLERLEQLFKKYGKKYDFDWLKIAALAYQESRLDQRAKSPSGAVGVMQIHPRTAADPNVGISDVDNLENNIHAGVKYLHFLRKRYFNDPAIRPAAKVDFTLAAYNAGPARIQSLRRRAKESGLDPNTWFFNVEVVASRDIGRETVEYVDNINKYFVAYTTAERLLESKSRRLKNSNQSN
jgi:membrane-bound lytic murein transglycosylase MltF